MRWLRQPDRAPALDERLPPAPDEIQGGILKPYRGIGSGCLVLARIENAAKARAFLGATLLPMITTGDAAPGPDGLHLNLAFTSNGLRRIGVFESELRQFPKEFREGMEARAGMLGDVRINHPDRWPLPPWNLNPPRIGPVPLVRMSTVDVILTFRKPKRCGTDSEWRPGHPLFGDVHKLSKAALAHGIRFVSVQPMYHLRQDGKGRPRDHFGFVDSVSQPTHEKNGSTSSRWDDTVELGELLVGHRNQRGDGPFMAGGDPGHQPGALIDNGSFLVVRKMRQHVRALHSALDEAAAEASLTRAHLMAKMMGRTLDGGALVPSPGANDFNYASDGDGAQCPFHAHIRRANPRTSQPTVPRIARRGMAYGRSYDEKAPDEADRGLVFMAYNASIAEQFEVIQRWITGGNSTGGCQRCRRSVSGRSCARRAPHLQVRQRWFGRARRPRRRAVRDARLGPVPVHAVDGRPASAGEGAAGLRRSYGMGAYRRGQPHHRAAHYGRKVVLRPRGRDGAVLAGDGCGVRRHPRRPSRRSDACSRRTENGHRVPERSSRAATMRCRCSATTSDSR